MDQGSHDVESVADMSDMLVWSCEAALLPGPVAIFHSKWQDVAPFSPTTNQGVLCAGA